MDSVVINSPSLANCNTLHIREDVEELRKAGVHFLHIDLMDGNYVPNLCFPLRFLKDLRQEYPDIILDVHMMVTDPGAYVESMAEAKVDYLSFHADSTPFAIRTIDKIRAANIRPGVVINPSQPVEVVEPYADRVEMVTLMAVEPGFAGQKFMPGTVERVETSLPEKYRVAEGNAIFNGVIFEIDDMTNEAIGIERINIR